MDIKEIQNLIKFVAKSGTSEVRLEMDDVKITIKNTREGSKEQPTVIHQMPIGVQQAPMQTQIPQALESATTLASTAPLSDEENTKYVTVKSPIIGTFYRKPSPDKPVYVEVGSAIKEGDILCTIEAMKLFNEIESEVTGTIVKVLVDDSSPVEFDQPLFLVDPS
jgi:acetyl-CoA carboxylase biotin carboxyl carrier protein